MEIKCDVKKCRTEAESCMIGVWLCEKHHLAFCNGTDLDTRKGMLAHCNGMAVLVGDDGKKEDRKED